MGLRGTFGSTPSPSTKEKIGTHNAYMRLRYVMVFWQGGAESVTMTKNNIQTKYI